MTRSDVEPVRGIVVALVAGGCIALPIAVVLVDALLGWPSGGFYAVFAPVVFVFAAVGWLISVRRPENAIGPLCLAFAVVFAAYFPIDLLVRLGHTAAALGVAATLSSASDAPGFIAVAMILILFPDGRLPGPRWRWTIVVAIGGTVGAFVGFGLAAGPLAAFPAVDNPIGVPGVPGAMIGELGYVALVILLGAAVAALIVRWRRGSSTERAQVKWVGAASVVLLVTEAINLATFDPSDPFGTPIAVILATLGTVVVPVAIGIAILRYRLYEIDRLISRTIGWAVVTGLLVALFAMLVVALQTLLAPLTEQNTLAVAASTLVAFALFQPLRRRVQRVVDRRFDRARYDAERVVDAFAGQLRNQVDLRSLESEVARVTRETVMPTSTVVWLRTVRKDDQARPS